MMERRSRFRHCINCGDEVYTYEVPRGNATEVICGACGYPIAVAAKGKRKGESSPPAHTPWPLPGTSRKPKNP